MIIDSHAHICPARAYPLPCEMLISEMDRYGVDMALVSNLEGAEFDSADPGRPIPIPQMELNRRTLECVRRHPDRLRGLFWIKPRNEGYTDEIEEFMAASRPLMAGFKAHPSLSLLAFDDVACEPYLRCAARLGAPVAVHSAPDQYADPSIVLRVARAHPDVAFIMVHMGLGSSSEAVLDMIASLPNLYGDTTWVPPGRVIEAVRACGSRKILFGTDSPINGPGTYEWYAGQRESIIKGLGSDEAADVLFANAARLFGFPDGGRGGREAG